MCSEQTTSYARTKKEETIEEFLAETTEEKALRIVRKNMFWAMGMGAIPVPLFDVAGVAGFQIKALLELSKLYEIPFQKHVVKNVLASLMGGYSSTLIGYMLGDSLLKLIPGVGVVAAIASTPIMAGAITYAVGKVFIQHFESGGTFLTFDPRQVRAYFKEQFEEGMKICKEMKNSECTKEKPVATETPAPAEKTAPAPSTESPKAAQETPDTAAPEKSESVDSAKDAKDGKESSKKKSGRS